MAGIMLPARAEGEGRGERGEGEGRGGRGEGGEERERGDITKEHSHKITGSHLMSNLHFWLSATKSIATRSSYR